ncbi:MAG: class I SAM-dependent methyltransferase [Polyangiaceae bacterium]|nr:class I SAM-dependent methyltransferase [Polyangiaceae bacterium]
MRAGHASRTARWVAGLRAAAAGLSGARAAARDDVALSLLPRRVAALARRVRRGGTPGYLALDALTLGLTSDVVLRTLRLDDVVTAGVVRGVRQIVLLGAGYDARAYRMEGVEQATFFEVDFPDTQADKRARLAGHAARAREVRHVGVDFLTQTIDAALLDAGLDRGAPSVFLWEGVTMYLPPDARRATIAAVARCAAPGSDLALTYSRREDVSRPLLGFAHLASHAIGEPLDGYVTRAQLWRELDGEGFEEIEDSQGPDWARRYWPTAPRLLDPVWERIAIARARSPLG